MDGLLSLSIHWESFLATGNGHFMIHIPTYKKEMSARLTPIDTLEFLSIPSLLHVLEIVPQFLFTVSCSPYVWYPNPIPIPLPSPT